MKAQTTKRLLVTLVFTLLGSLVMVDNAHAAKPTDEQKAEMAVKVLEKCTAQLKNIKKRTMKKVETRTVKRIEALPEDQLDKTNHIVKIGLRHVRSAARNGSRALSKECRRCMSKLKRLGADTGVLKERCEKISDNIKAAAKETSDTLNDLRIETDRPL